jgi:hypothetical protein
MTDRCIKAKIAEIQEQFVQNAPKPAAWSSVQVLSSSQVKELKALQMSGDEMNKAGVSAYSFTDPSEVPANIKMLSTLPELEKELDKVQAEVSELKKCKLGQFQSQWKLEVAVSFAVVLAAVLSCCPQQVQLGVLVSFVLCLGSWCGTSARSISQQLQVMTELQIELLQHVRELKLQNGWSYSSLRKIEFSLVYREGNIVKLLLQMFDKLNYCEKRLKYSNSIRIT